MKKTLLLSTISIIAIIIVFSINSKSFTGAHVDHNDNINGPFKTPQDVTTACLECHFDVPDEFMKTNHWTWSGPEFEKNGVKIKPGKKNAINNFCIALSSNEPRCTSCHAGFGWKDGTFDFTKKENIDCLVCHDQTGTYKKSPTGAGMPDTTVDLVKVAKSVGRPTKANCGACHFNGGGGSGVKHGDLDPSLLNASKELDVHMGGQKFECTTCHKTEKHQIAGAGHTSMASGTNQLECTNCHSLEKGIHTNKLLNKHANNVACETCHIPAFAREMATKTFWDWSTAGQKEDAKGEDGLETYSKMKGDFKWEKNVKPTYVWYNGSADYYQIGDKITDKIVSLNKINGVISDPKSKITPFKVMRGKQIYDSKNNYLIVPKLFGKDGYWKTFDWKAASEIGMKSINLPFSGEFGFIETEMYWPINHQVAPKTQALKCTECHSSGTRLDWAKLGYSGDPMKKGGREKNGLLKK